MRRLVVGFVAVLSSSLALSAPPPGKGGGNGNGGGGGEDPPPPPVLEEPASLSATAVGETQIDLSWTDGGGTTTGFWVKFSDFVVPGDCAGGTDVGTATSYSATGLSEGTTYGFRVCSYDGSAVSAGVTAQTTTLSPPQPPAANEAWRQMAGYSDGTRFLSVEIDEARNRVYGIGYYSNAASPENNGWMIQARDMTTGQLDASFNGTGEMINSNATQTRGSAIDSQGNLYICSEGCRADVCQPGSGKGKKAVPDTTGYIGAMIGKYSPDGTLLADVTPHNDNNSTLEVCVDIAASYEGGEDFLYVYDKDGADAFHVSKMDTDGNVVWDVNLGQGEYAYARTTSEIAVGSSGVYLNLSQGQNFSYEIKKFDLSTGSELASVTGAVTDSRSTQNGMSVSTVGGVEYVWYSPLYDRAVTRYNADLTAADSSACNGLDTSGFAHHIHTYNLLAVGEYLYLPSRTHLLGMSTTAYDFGVLRFDMSGGGCDSNNEAGELFDFATHNFNFGPPDTRDAALDMVSSANGDIYVVGYGAVAGGLSDGAMMKFLGQ